MSTTTSRRPASATSNASSSSRFFGRTFADGERIDSKRTSLVGGMSKQATPAWSVASYRPNDNHIYDFEEHKMQHIYMNKGDSCLGYSTQKKGAAKTVIPGDLSKPLFLKRILNFANEELRIIGAQRYFASIPKYLTRIGSDEAGSPRRLQEFKTYQSILTDIKREYELTIDRQRNELVQFEIIKSKLSIMDFKMTTEIQKAVEGSKAAIDEILKSKQTVQAELESKNLEIMQLNQQMQSLYLEINRLQKEKQIRNENNREAQELKAMTLQFEEFERKTKDSLEMKDKHIEELMIQKKILQTELLESTTQMGKLKNVTVGLSKDIVEGLEKKLADEQANSKKLQEEKEKMASESRALEKKFKDIKYALQKNETSQVPDWGYIQMQFVQSIQHYSNLATSLDYNDAIVAIIRDSLKAEMHESVPQPSKKETKTELPPEPKSMITPVQKKVEDNYFPGKGLHQAVPKYLRTKHKVLNRHLSKYNTLLLINDTWDAKALYEATNSISITLGEFLYIYLKKRFGSQDVICEWGYNLTEACAKYKDISVECLYFLDILNNEIDEDVYLSVRQLIEYFKNSLYRCDVKTNFGTARGYLEKSEFLQIINQIFSDKTVKQIQQLEEALNMDQSGDIIIPKLLYEGESQFLETLKMQLHQDREAYIKHIEQYMMKMSRDDTISVFEAEQMFKEYDPQKNDNDRELLIARGFGLMAEDLKPNMTLSKKKVLDNLRKGVLRKGNRVYDMPSI